MIAVHRLFGHVRRKAPPPGDLTCLARHPFLVVHTMSFSPLFNTHTSPHDRDFATFSNYTDVVTQHLDLDWEIDWKKRVISGSVTLRLAGKADEVVLDASHLDVHKVEVDGKEVKWDIGEHVGTIGQPFTIHKVVNGTAHVKVYYSTTKDCSAVGWLEPDQTKSGKHPYLYSQSQAIHARSLLPCQDTPAVKATYAAKVRGELPILMSALRANPESKWEGHAVYNQPVAIPSYLIAIASGELVYRPFKQLEGRKWRSGCWAEPLMMDDAFWEFSEDTARFVAAAEDLTSEYRWGVYDILFLPESFPYGGMENSCLTFATPTVIAHDRSSVDLAAHEIAHSWFGNSIGVASWSHFWLNEVGQRQCSDC